MDSGAGLAFQGLLYLAICWSMSREMRRRPDGPFFRPVLLGLVPIVMISAASFVAVHSMTAAELGKAQDLLAAQFSRLLQGGEGAKPFPPEELRALSEISLRLQPALVCVFWLALLTLSALGIRRWLKSRGLPGKAKPLSRWRAPYGLIWSLLIPGAVLALNKRGWLGEVEPWIVDLCLNLLVLSLAVYLFQGMMVMFERIGRMGLPRLAAGLMLASAMFLALLPQGRGAALALLALGVLDTWFDFRKLTPKQDSDKRSGS